MQCYWCILRTIQLYERQFSTYTSKHDLDYIPRNSKIHGANMGPTWVLSAPCGPHVGPINLAIRVAAYVFQFIFPSEIAFCYIKINVLPYSTHITLSNNTPNSKVHGANMRPIWGRQDPGGLYVGPMNFAIRDSLVLWIVKLHEVYTWFMITWGKWHIKKLSV